MPVYIYMNLHIHTISSLLDYCMVDGFKTPSGHAPKNHNKTHCGHRPDKWTYYNLEDVTEEQLSERSNTAVAMSFLNTLKQKTGTDGASTKPIESSDERHVFNLQKFDATSVSSELKDKQFRNGALCMAEYVVGEPVQRKQKHYSSNQKSGFDSISLEHLREEDIDKPTGELQEQTKLSPDKVTFMKRKNKAKNSIRTRVEHDSDEGMRH